MIKYNNIQKKLFYYIDSVATYEHILNLLLLIKAPLSSSRG
jgi:hypothetical protein